jgi:multicomponent K+:H+ antiporter subunit E
MLPHPFLTLLLLLMWLLLNGFTPGHLLLGTLIAVFASWAMAALRPRKSKLRKWYLLPRLFLLLIYDIIVSNIAVAGLILRGQSARYNSKFVTMPLELEDRTALSLFAIIVASTPGSAWLEYNSNDKTVLIHVLDLGLADETEWSNSLKTRYETLLMEIFE